MKYGAILYPIISVDDEQTFFAYIGNALEYIIL